MSFKDKFNRSDRKKKAAEPKQNPGGKKPKKDSAFKKVGKAFLAFMMVMVMVCCVAGCVVTVWVFDALGTSEQLLNLDMQKAKFTTIFYADDGVTELSRAYDPESGNRIWVDIEQMPKHLLDTVVAVEDKRFWDHNGVDFVTTTKAGLNAILQEFGFTGFYGGATPGGSTITQQVVRNITDDRAVDGAAGWARKLREIFRAVNVEKHYSKDQIIETYLNLAGFSQNCSGIQAAANVFFNKDVSELSVAECATIVGTTKNPTAYNPYTKWEANQERKEYILSLMLEQELLTQAEYEAAMAEEIVLSYEHADASIQSWFMDYVTEAVCKDLAAKEGITEAEAYQNLIGGGYRIYTTCDTNVQTILEDYYNNLEGFPPVNNEEYPESAFVITDTSGAIKGLVGSNRPKEGNRVWNRASDTLRQIGSTIKPITSYTLGIENDLITFSTVIEDRQVVLNPDPIDFTEDLWAPRNEYNSFKGFVTVRYALIRSINTVAVQITQQLGTATSFDFLKYSLGIDSLTAGDNGYSPMALGSLTKGVTLIDMAGAYQMFANGGVRTEPYCYTKVTDSAGKVILETNTVPVRVISTETATVMNKLLQEVTGWEGTGAAANLGSIPVAGKTGTTDDSVDQWFVGVTPYYVGVCWLGYDSRYQVDDAGKIIYDDDNKPIPNSVSYAGVGYPPPKLWKAVMSRVHEGCYGKEFEVSTNVLEHAYCADTGMLAGPGCSNTATGWYKMTNIPQTCTYHNFGDSYGVGLVGHTGAECGVEYTDQYLVDAYVLMSNFNEHVPEPEEGEETTPADPSKRYAKMTTKEAIELVQKGITWDNFYYSEEYQDDFRYRWDAPNDFGWGGFFDYDDMFGFDDIFNNSGNIFGGNDDDDDDHNGGINIFG